MLKDKVIQTQSDKLDLMMNMMINLTASVDKIEREQTTSVKSLVEKPQSLYPNEVYAVDDVADDIYIKAASAMANMVKTTERSMSFKESPYNYVLELCGNSNAVASNYGLSKNQQRLLILSHVPATSDVYKELKDLQTLDSLFHFTNISASATLTRGEAETQLESWHLDVSTSETMTASISRLKRLILEVAGKEYSGNHRFLYTEVVKKIRHEKLPAWALRSLDECRVRMEQEDSVDKLHAILLASLKPLVGHKPKTAPVIKRTEAEVMMNSEVEYEGPSKNQNRQSRPQGKGKAKGKGRSKSRSKKKVKIGRAHV